MTGDAPPEVRPRAGRRGWRRRPLLATAVALVAVVFVALGVWQLQRLGEVRARNDRLEQRIAEDPIPYADVDGDPGAARVDRLAYRRTEVAGTYDATGQVLIRSRQHDGQNGFHLLTPLRPDHGTAVLVNRGWIPAGVDAEPAVAVAPPDGRVEVSGTLRRSEQPPGLFGARDPAEGPLDRAFRIDIDRLAPQFGYEVLPMWVALEAQQPDPGGRLPIPLPRPEPDQGPHLSYAVQWFSFAVIAVVGFGAYVRRDREAGDG